MAAMRVFSLALPVVLAAAALAVQSGALSGSAPTDLGLQNGRLKPPSDTRNSVSSQAALYPDHPQQAYAAVDPLPFNVGGVEASMVSLARVLETMPGVRIVQRQPDYLRAEATTRWLRFVDDLEFWADPAAQAVQVRSASRLGREDFGTNRARVDELRTRYLAQP